MKEESGMNFLEHAEELRKRIIYSVIPILVSFIPCYLFSKQLFDLLMGP
ncbi:MAG: preprotein translocase subunit TatC, partial [Candidatus Dadabacteria bacterium]|nr:preprotein translocase subunit TatC [Candidatus Dadabacteria bacterium]